MSSDILSDGPVKDILRPARRLQLAQSNLANQDCNIPNNIAIFRGPEHPV
jgi:hypothetical protein